MSPRTAHARWAAALAILLAGSIASAQAPEPQDPPIIVPGEGTELFRHLVYSAGFRPAKDIDDPANMLVIVLGDPTPLGEWTKWLLDNGGSLLIATDRRFTDTYLRVNVPGRFVEVDKSQGYRGSTFCPIVEAVGEDFMNPEKPSSIFALPAPPGQPIATNNPSAVRILRPAIFSEQASPTVLARYQSTAHFTDGRDFNRNQDFFAVGGTTQSAGRFLVLADHSVFINRMMRQELGDTGNEDFARNCLAWLGQRPNGQRTKCMFFEDNQVASRFDLPMPKMPDPPFDVIADTVLNHGNDIVREMEDRDLANRMLLDEFGLRPIIRFILIMVTILTILYGFFKLWGARTGANPATALLARAWAFAPRGTAVRQRTAAQLDTGNLYELARDRVREKFDSLGGVGAGEPPHIVVADAVPAARRLRKSVEHLWRIGYGAIPIPVPRRDWAWFNAELERAARAGRDGLWRFEPTSDKT